MQDFPLTIGMIFRHGRTVYADSEVVTFEGETSPAVHLRRGRRPDRAARAPRSTRLGVGDRDPGRRRSAGHRRSRSGGRAPAPRPRDPYSRGSQPRVTEVTSSTRRVLIPPDLNLLALLGRNDEHLKLLETLRVQRPGHLPRPRHHAPGRRGTAPAGGESAARADRHAARAAIAGRVRHPLGPSDRPRRAGHRPQGFPGRRHRGAVSRRKLISPKTANQKRYPSTPSGATTSSSPSVRQARARPTSPSPWRSPPSQAGGVGASS